MGNRQSPDHAFPVDTTVPDVQDFAFSLWNKYGAAPGTTHLGSGSHSGTYGDLSNPSVTFATGSLRVNAGETFRGAGVLVIRDAFDPNVDTDNTPTTKAKLEISGRLEWTGLVIVAAWTPAHRRGKRRRSNNRRRSVRGRSRAIGRRDQSR
jgi:hypothetical protein